MPDGHRKGRSTGSESGSDASTSSRQSRRSLRLSRPPTNGPPTPTSPLEARTKKRKAHFEDDPVDDVVYSATDTHFRGPPSASSPISRFCLCQAAPKIPRPRNAFILYRQHHAPSITAKDPRIPNPEQSKIIANDWNSLSEAEKEPWHKLAEEEKYRHAQQYPGYRYQPKRSRRSSNLDSPLSAGFTNSCDKCGGRTMLSPTSSQPVQNNGQQQHPMLPPVNLSAQSDQPRFLPPVTSLNMPNPNQARRITGGRPPPPGFNIAQQEYNADDHYNQDSPDAKRRRFTAAGAYGGMLSNHQPHPATPYPGQSPYSHDFSAMQEQHQHQQQQQQQQQQHHQQQQQQRQWTGPPPRNGGSMHPPPPPPPPPNGSRPSNAPTTTDQPPRNSLQAQLAAGKSAESIIMEMPWYLKLRAHNRISPPLKAPPSNPNTKPTHPQRGVIIAIEGDTDAVVSKIGIYLEEQLKRDPKNEVIVERGPSGPPSLDKPLTIGDFIAHVSNWQQRSRKMVEWITGASSSSSTLAASGLGGDNMTDGSNASRPFEIEDELISPRTTTRPILPSQASASTSPWDPAAKTPTASTHANGQASQAGQAKTPTAAQHAQSLSHLQTYQSQSLNQPHPNQSQHQHPSHSQSQTQQTFTHPAANPPPPTKRRILLLHNHLYTATNAWATKLPLIDNYNPHDHWQWAATLWRGSLGADLTLFVKDHAGQEMGKDGVGKDGVKMVEGKAVEVREDMRCILVRREGGTSGNSTAGLGTGSGLGVDESTFRRVGFEVDEWLRGMRQRGGSAGGGVGPVVGDVGRRSVG